MTLTQLEQAVERACIAARQQGRNTNDIKVAFRDSTERLTWPVTHASSQGEWPNTMFVVEDPE